MADVSDLIAVALTEDERDFVQQTLEQWALSAASTPFPFQALGLSTWDEFVKLTGRLERAVVAGDPLTDLDWARVLFLTEVTWASNLVGSGLDFVSVTRFSDTAAVGLLRGLQRKISSRKRAKLLFPDGGRTPDAAETEDHERWLEQLRSEQQGRQYPPGL
ncbi:MAG: hypothetical protein WB777_10665 [Mycobacterium sp.]